MALRARPKRVVRSTLALFLAIGFLVSVTAESYAPFTDLPLMGSNLTTFSRFYRHIASKNGNMDEYYVRRLYDTYLLECRKEGVDPVVALSQMVHETNYLLFTGAVGATQYNYAGLGSTSPGTPGLDFGTMDVGVRAHVQHLKAYGSTDPLVGDLVDPRFSFVTRGSAPTVMALTGRWAVDPGYGPKLLAHAYRLIVPSARP